MEVVISSSKPAEDEYEFSEKYEVICNYIQVPRRGLNGQYITAPRLNGFSV